ncbi:hypothetical protein NLG97_g10281 [Lecanicillium saksenae]|uniref:Uncharacterized protein n=1 Tax=Lecanicillium saksenae TaxID=468837 RepID=A0ACC1QGN0_9HYPO|nr:hypothetical protein NLG97_g10281 [Lecanicillium saksenae]
MPQQFLPLQYEAQPSPFFRLRDAMGADDMLFSQSQQQLGQPPPFSAGDAMDEDSFLSQSQHQSGQTPLVSFEHINFDDDDDGDAVFDPAPGSSQQPPPSL